jgi:hypothetical protein
VFGRDCHEALKDGLAANEQNLSKGRFSALNAGM